MVWLPRVLMFPLLLVLVSCQMAANREAHRAQALLDESELLMEGRELSKAREKAELALSKLTALEPSGGKEETDHTLLEVRAHFAIFMSDNLLTMEAAKIRRKSLVRFADPATYASREEHLAPALLLLRQLIESKVELNVDQSAFVHGMLGAILRLEESSLIEADKEYGKAIRVYQVQLDERKMNPPKIGSNTTSIHRLENQVSSLQMAQAEIMLLAEEWDQALNRLENALAGKDLHYFEVQFEILRDAIKDAEKAIAETDRTREGSREEKLMIALENKRMKEKSRREALASANPYRMQLTLAKIKSSDAVNNLMYRMICFHQLQRWVDFEQARAILERFHPDLASDLETALKTNG